MTIDKHEVVVDRDWLNEVAEKLDEEGYLPDLASEIRQVAYPTCPKKIRTEDGYAFTRQEDGSYTDGDLTYGSLEELKRHVDVIEE